MSISQMSKTNLSVGETVKKIVRDRATKRFAFEVDGNVQMKVEGKEFVNVGER